MLSLFLQHSDHRTLVQCNLNSPLKNPWTLQKCCQTHQAFWADQIWNQSTEYGWGGQAIERKKIFFFYNTMFVSNWMCSMCSGLRHCYEAPLLALEGADRYVLPLWQMGDYSMLVPITRSSVLCPVHWGLPHLCCQSVYMCQHATRTA